MIEIIQQAFTESQHKVTVHKRHAVKLKKALLYSNGNELNNFISDFITCINKILCIGAKEYSADKCVKFIDSFLLTLYTNDEIPNEINETVKNIFTRTYLAHLVTCTEASAKHVRFKACQLLAHALDTVDEVDNDLFESIKDQLIIRCRDKETSIRAQAVRALAKFQTENGDPIDALLFALRHDPAMSVRMAALANLEVRKETIPYLVERIRDIEPSIRKYVYTQTMHEVGDLRVFSIADRELILSWGLTDRNPAVKAACISMVNDLWINCCNNSLIEFLEKLDVVNSNIIDTLLTELYKSNPEYAKSLDKGWVNGKMTAEKAVATRVYFERVGGDDLPEVVSLASSLQYILNEITSLADNDDERVDVIIFTCRQLIKICMLLDYNDEVGRKAMQELLTSYLQMDRVEIQLIPDVFDLLLRINYNQETFASIILSILRFLSDNDNLDHAFQGLSLNDSSRRHFICIVYIKELLERINSSLNSLSQITSLFSSVIFPGLNSSVQQFQELCFDCVLLFCTSNRDFALQNLDFLVKAMDENSTVSVRNSVIKTIFDLIFVYGFDLIDEPRFNEFTDILRDIIDASEHPQLISTAVEGLVRMFVFMDFKNIDLLGSLISFYFTCDFSQHENTLQILSFFFPSFCRNKFHIHDLAIAFSAEIVNVLESDLTANENQIISQMYEWLCVECEDFNNIDFSDVYLKLLNSIQGREKATVKFALQFLLKMTSSLPAKPNEQTLAEINRLFRGLKEDTADRVIQNLLQKLETNIFQNI